MKTIIEKFEALSQEPSNPGLQKNLIVELAKYNCYEAFDYIRFSSELLETWKDLWNSIKDKEERDLDVGRAQMVLATKNVARFFDDCTKFLYGSKPVKPVSSLLPFGLRLSTIAEEEDHTFSGGITSPS